MDLIHDKAGIHITNRSIRDDYLDAPFEAGIDEPIGIGHEGVIAITVLYRDEDTVIEQVKTILPNTKVMIES